jgi:phospholipase/carboxylesterase
MLVAAGCVHGGRPAIPVDEAARRARLEARPTPPGRLDIATGLQPLELGNQRDGLMYIPRGYRADRPAPLLLLLHGATGNGEEILDDFQALADELDVVIVAPDSRAYTWDVVAGGLGPDVAFVERALERTFARVAIDPARIAIAGFSDGASYALTLGLANGDLFGAVMSFSPGFLATTQQRGAPRIFLAHCVADQILPIETTARPIADKLRRAGYRLEYREFEIPLTSVGSLRGPKKRVPVANHSVSPEIARAAFAWWLGTDP